ncbi:two-component system sensor histidine kinase RstB [Gallaecimonas kandeliae]|uniref:two-component system sensor histidine kinase RstB n=1 Tax=Gallaecimonas kandeliae TaxID=3029055 RepID=UPI0026477FFF|nr:two-component system sensor histidine kinase RstB [Gallaecimonas kandeliae]WKE64613.1 two-component system sensor histidine kinase RstB [Gallaecimonas kandeliae]
MRRLFIQFYLLLMAGFMAAALLIGALYQGTAERASNRYLEGLVQDFLDRFSQELSTLPQAQWPGRMQDFSRQLGLSMHSAALAGQPLGQADLDFLTEGNIVIVEDDDTFRQRIPGTETVLIVGPVPYLSFQHELRWFNIGLLLLLGLSLALPILLWLRPHWRGLQALVTAAQRLGAGDLSARARLPAKSSLAELGATFDQMAQRLQASIKGRKQLTDAIAHELRSPLVRLRYRLALLEAPAPAKADLDRDLDALEHLIEEMLSYSRLSQPELPLNLGLHELGPWARGRLADWQALGPERSLLLEEPSAPLYWQGDLRLLERAMDNLVANALRHCASEVRVRVEEAGGQLLLTVSDDGPGIAADQAERIFEPFVRLDQSRDRRTGGIGLGLAIVRSIALAHGGEVMLLPSPKGARFRLALPVHLDTNRHQGLTEAGTQTP